MAATSILDRSQLPLLPGEHLLQRSDETWDSVVGVKISPDQIHCPTKVNCVDSEGNQMQGIAFRIIQQCRLHLNMPAAHKYAARAVTLQPEETVYVVFDNNSPVQAAWGDTDYVNRMWMRHASRGAQHWHNPEFSKTWYRGGCCEEYPFEEVERRGLRIKPGYFQWMLKGMDRDFKVN